MGVLSILLACLLLLSGLPLSTGGGVLAEPLDSSKNQITARGVDAKYALGYNAWQEASGVDKDGNPNAPNGVRLREYIEPVKAADGTRLENLFDVTVQVESSAEFSKVERSANAAVALTIDLSLSMDEDRIKAIKSAAIQFIQQYYTGEEGVVRNLAVVLFGQSALAPLGWQNINTKTELEKVYKLFGYTGDADLNGKDNDGDVTGEDFDAAKSGQTETANNVINGFLRYTNIASKSDLQADGGYTNLSAAVMLADNLFGDLTKADYQNGEAADFNLYDIIFTDGLPTARTTTNTGSLVQIDYTAPTVPTNMINNPDGTITIYSYTYKQVVVGDHAIGEKFDGTAVSGTGANSSKYYPSDHRNEAAYELARTSSTVPVVGDWVNSAKDAADSLKKGDVRILGVAYPDAEKSLALQQIADEGDVYAAADASELALVFGAFNDTIKLLSEVNRVTLPFSGPVKFVAFNAPGSSYAPDAGDRGLTWNSGEAQITWDLTHSGVQLELAETSEQTTYTYTESFRVLLDTLDPAFVAGREETATAERAAAQILTGSRLTYKPQLVEDQLKDAVFETAYFYVPKVKGFAADLSFTKVSSENGDGLADAKFILTLSEEGVDESVRAATAQWQGIEVTSGADGTVTLSNIPSGHSYILTETAQPEGYEFPVDYEFAAAVAWGIAKADFADGNIKNDPVQEYGSLTITKEVKYYPVDSDDQDDTQDDQDDTGEPSGTTTETFTVAVTFSNEDGTPYEGRVYLADAANTTGSYPEATLVDGVWTQEFSDGDAYTLTRIPAGVHWEVAEILNVEQAELYESEIDNPSGTVTADNEDAVTITNWTAALVVQEEPTEPEGKETSFTLRKIVVIDPESDLEPEGDEEFKFKIALDEKHILIQGEEFVTLKDGEAQLIALSLAAGTAEPSLETEGVIPGLTVDEVLPGSGWTSVGVWTEEEDGGFVYTVTNTYSRSETGTIIPDPDPDPGKKPEDLVVKTDNNGNDETTTRDPVEIISGSNETPLGSGSSFADPEEQEFIDDAPVPLGSGLDVVGPEETVFIDDAPVPLGSADEEVFIVFDGETPLGDLPKTGEVRPWLLLVAALFGALGCRLLRKAEEDDASGI
jgi:uncharacterized protein YegL